MEAGLGTHLLSLVKEESNVMILEDCDSTALRTDNSRRHMVDRIPDPDMQSNVHSISIPNSYGINNVHSTSIIMK
ncbi:hypothetical protein V6N11_066045 [Hibiscus sabdariffa]|uniref:Uncharacterized protein n=2 Tax=Hibiscus sabdariffa TaxID=183260 RepID=A0ABR2B7A9_9ROSI